MIKICFFCRHCEHEAGFAYSEMTWSSEETSCRKGHWTIYPESASLVDIGKELLRAETCPDFEAAEGCEGLK